MLSTDIALQLISPKQVWYAWFPFAEDRTQGKDRPVLILDVDDDNVHVWATKITKSRPYDEHDVELDEWADIPLDFPSTASPINTVIIPKTQLRRYAGVITDHDWERIMEEFRKMKS